MYQMEKEGDIKGRQRRGGGYTQDLMSIFSNLNIFITLKALTLMLPLMYSLC